MASKITIKRSLTAAAPAGLSFGEMAFVQGSGLTANQLYVGISGGNPVWVGAQIGTTGTWTDNAAKTSLATQFATDQRISSLITSAATGVSSVNGATGAVVNVALTTNSLSQFAATTSAQLLGVISDETGTGSLVFATSPTLVTPALGTPSALVGTNISGTATAFTASNVTTNANLTGHITSTGNATVLGTAAFSSANLAGALTDETGSGSAVFATSPTLVTPALGTPSALVGTNISGTATAFTASNVTTNANLTGHITSTGNAAVLGSFTSGQLATALTDETGSGAAVFATSPSFTTSVIGSATMAVFNTISTTVNGFGAATTMSLGATTGNAAIRNPVLTLGNTTNTIATNSADANHLTIAPFGNLILLPSRQTEAVGDVTSVTITNSDQAAGTVSIYGGNLYLGNKNAGGGAVPVNIVFEGATADTNETTLTVTNPTADRTITLPDATGTVALTANKLSVFAATTSSELLGVISDETGTGSLVFATSPTLVSPALGTPLSGTLTNCTFPTLNQNTTGTANEAEILATPRNINGTAFDGSADITVTAAANTLTGATLASNVLASSLTSVGTLGSLSITGDLTVGGTFTVNGTVTTINSTTLTVDDKNIELGSVAVPTNDTAADGGISLLGTTTKTLKWINSGAFAWTSSENFDLVSTKAYYIAGASVLNATTLGSAIVTSSLTSVGTLTSLTVSGTLEAGLIDGGTF